MRCLSLTDRIPCLPFAGFALMVFDHYIGLVSWYFSVFVYLHVPEYSRFFVSGDHCWFMFIPLARYLDVVVLTNHPPPGGGGGA